jgi:NADH-quinone oxidoreductase subunit G
MLELPGFDFEDIDAVRAELPAAGGIASLLSNATRVAVESLPSAPAELERIADVPIYASDSLVRRAPSLQKTRDAQVPAVRINPATMTTLHLVDGGAVRVRQAGGEAMLKVVADAGVPEDCVRIAAAHPATSALGPMFGPIAAEPV